MPRAACRVALATSWRSSTKLFHSPQSGQRPSHFELSKPQAWHWKTVLSLLMAVRESGRSRLIGIHQIGVRTGPGLGKSLELVRDLARRLRPQWPQRRTAMDPATDPVRDTLSCEDYLEERPAGPGRRRLRRAPPRTRLAGRPAGPFRRPRRDREGARTPPRRRCSLACAYRNQYDHVSAPVPLATMLARIDHLAALGTAIVTLSGGEPLLHPDATALIGHIRRRGMVATLITNGYLLTPGLIERLNRVGLDHLQISIDNVEPDDVSMKSLRVLEHRLRWLAERADFVVNVNTVIGGGFRKPADALAVAARARELGFTSTVDLLNGHEAE